MASLRSSRSVSDHPRHCTCVHHTAHCTPHYYNKHYAFYTTLLMYTLRIVHHTIDVHQVRLRSPRGTPRVGGESPRRNRVSIAPDCPVHHQGSSKSGGRYGDADGLPEIEEIDLLTAIDLERAKLLWSEALRGARVWLGMLSAPLYTVRLHRLMLSVQWRWMLILTMSVHCLVTYWEPSGLWNAANDDEGWTTRPACSRLYSPHNWTAPVDPAVARPVGGSWSHTWNGPVVLEWICLLIYMINILLRLITVGTSQLVGRDRTSTSMQSSSKVQPWTELIVTALLVVDGVLWSAVNRRLFRPLRPVLIIITQPALWRMACLAISSTIRLWGIYFLLVAAVYYFALFAAYWFGPSGSTCSFSNELYVERGFGPLSSVNIVNVAPPYDEFLTQVT